MNRPSQRYAGWWPWPGRVFLCMLMLVLILPLPAHAAEIRNEDIVVIGPDEVINDNLIVLADQFTLQGTVNGRLYVVASTITIDGTVTSDLNAAGWQVTMNGTAQSVRMAGQEVVLGADSRIMGEAFLGALTLMQRSGSQINGSLAFAGASALLSGQIGTARSTAGMVQPVRFLALTTDMSRATFRQQTPAERQEALRASFIDMLHWFLSLLILGGLMIWLIPDLLAEAATRLQQRPLPSLLWGLMALPGLLVFILAFILALVLLVMAFNALGLGNLVTLTIISGGVALVALITGIVILLTYGGNIIAGYLLGKLLLQRSQAAWVKNRVVPLVLGILVISVLSSIPGLGFVVRILATLGGLGALWLLWQLRPEPVAAVVPAAA